MGQVAVDFGTGNTVLARLDERTGAGETIEIPGISTPVPYRLHPGDPQRIVHVVPSLIHYTPTETLIGQQVLSRGLADHADTIRWMKRRIAQRLTARRKTPQGHKGPAEAGQDFLRLILEYGSDLYSLEDDAFTFTAPVEAFEDFQDWLRRVSEGVGIRRVRFLDEPTACVLGYRGVSRRDEPFLIFDFGCGTLDVSAVRVDLAATEGPRAIQLGQAGRDLGGMDVDRWLLDDFCRRHALSELQRRNLEAAILIRVERAKILLSDPDLAQVEVEVEIPGELEGRDGRGRPAGTARTAYSRSCGDCERGRAGEGAGAERACLGCILLAQGFLKQARETLERALENAAVRVGLRRNDVVRALVTGGTSLVPSVRRLLEETFEGKVDYANPFDAVARGACCGIVVPILQHDYAIESYSRQKRDYEFKPLFEMGTEYPTPRDAVRLWARGSYDGMTRIGIKIFEVSRVKQRALDVAMVDAEGVLRDESRVVTDRRYICLNRDNPTFIVADPPVVLERDSRRFLCSFQVDGNRRLVVTVRDNLSGKVLLEDHPVVRL